MKKIFCKKTLSAFLATVMILAMIPVGMISAVAADAGYTKDDETKTITITSAAGWNAVADTEAYAAYNFVLGGNIDFSETDEDKPLFSSVAFAGTFDGGVYTISNFNAGTTSSRVAYQGIIAGTTVESTITDSEIDTTKYIEIKNVTLVNAVLHSSANCGGLVGQLNTYGKFENIKIENITISGTASNGWVGGMVGFMQPTALIFAVNCNVTTGTTGSISSNREAGGILARLSDTACSYNNATNIFQNCYVDANITTNNNSGRIGGIVGAWGRYNSGAVAAISIDSCYAAGTYSNNNDTTGNRAAGIVGACAKATITISNVVINVANLECAVCSFGVNGNGELNLTLNNVYYTSTNKGNGGRYIFQNFSAYTEGSADTKIESTDVSTLVKMENGFIKGVAGSLVGDMHAQVTNVVGEKYIIRFVMPAMTADMTDVKMTIAVKNGEEVVHTYEIPCTMWDKLTNTYEDKTIVDDEDKTAYEAEADFGAEKLLAGAIVGVPTGTAYSFEVSTTFTVNGIEITSTTYGANVTAQGALNA